MGHWTGCLCFRGPSWGLLVLGRYGGIWARFSIEAQVLQHLVNLLPGHVMEGDSLKLLILVTQQHKLRVGSREVFRHQVVVVRDILGDEEFHLLQPIQLSSSTRLHFAPGQATKLAPVGLEGDSEESGEEKERQEATHGTG